jgi:hypothetical protein
MNVLRSGNLVSENLTLGNWTSMRRPSLSRSTWRILAQDRLLSSGSLQSEKVPPG